MSEKETRYILKQIITGTIIDPLLRGGLLLALEDAEQRRMNTAISGRTDDGGADVLQQKVAAYIHGWNHCEPSWLTPYVTEVKHELDPDFAEYSRLHKKFGGLEPREKKDFSKMPPKPGPNVIPSNEDLLKDFR